MTSVSAAETTINNSTAGGINGAITNDPIDTIILDPGVYSGNNNTQIVINKSVTIKGNGPSNTVIIDGSNLYRIFNVTGTGTLTLINVTLKDGFANSPNSFGGAVYNLGTVTMTDCVLTGNQAGLYGGAIYNNGILNTNNCVFDENYAPQGGSIFNDPIGRSYINNSTFSNGIADDGGAIVNYGNMSIINSTFINNSAADFGGAIISQGRLSIIGSIFRNNTAMQIGGAITIGPNGTLNISHSILVDNNVVRILLFLIMVILLLIIIGGVLIILLM